MIANRMQIYLKGFEKKEIRRVIRFRTMFDWLCVYVCFFVACGFCWRVAFGGFWLLVAWSFACFSAFCREDQRVCEVFSGFWLLVWLALLAFVCLSVSCSLSLSLSFSLFLFPFPFSLFPFSFPFCCSLLPFSFYRFPFPFACRFWVWSFSCCYKEIIETCST